MSKKFEYKKATFEAYTLTNGEWVGEEVTGYTVELDLGWDAPVVVGISKSRSSWQAFDFASGASLGGNCNAKTRDAVIELAIERLTRIGESDYLKCSKSFIDEHHKKTGVSDTSVSPEASAPVTPMPVLPAYMELPACAPIPAVDLKDQTDEQLMESIQAGSESAFEVLYKRHYNYVNIIVFQRLKNREDTEEVVNDTFLRVWRHRDKYDPSISKFTTWVHTIAHNASVVYQKSMMRNKRQWDLPDNRAPLDKTKPIMSREPDPVDEVLKTECAEILDSALLQVSKPNRRLAWILYHLEEYNTTDIANILQVSRGGAHYLICECEKELKSILQDIDFSSDSGIAA